MTQTPDINTQPLAEVDPEIAAALADELGRQRGTLEMIASENFVPRAILETQGSVLTNKYAEGYPGRRYYGGCEHVDEIERIAIDRVKALFGAEYANVQPHSGAQANASVMHALIRPGDTVLGLIAEDTGRPLEQIFEDSLHDRWYTAPQAREYGFIDAIVRDFREVVPRRRRPVGIGGGGAAA